MAEEGEESTPKELHVSWSVLISPLGAVLLCECGALLVYVCHVLQSMSQLLKGQELLCGEKGSHHALG